MTIEEIKEFFGIGDRDLPSFEELKSRYSDEELEQSPELLISGLLKKSFGYPISFFDTGIEDNVTLSPERSDEVYEEFALDILRGNYENLYSFAQDFAAGVPNE